MELIEVLGFAGAAIAGLTLGLIGGGGSILIVPVLVYVMSIDPVLATAYSLFVVGASSLVGAGNYMKKALLSYKTAVVFAIPSFIAVFLTRKFLVPAIPQEIGSIGNYSIEKGMALMVFFAVIMLFSAINMIRKKKNQQLEEEAELTLNYPLIMLVGLMEGTITGIVGAGGGFLIIPALVLLARLPMKMAVGTSLLIIGAKSLLGFLGDVSTQSIEWSFLLSFTALAVAGIFIGSWLTKFIPGHKLKTGFGWFVAAMGVYILFKELILV
jgi:uncharacterized protein